MPYAQFLMFLAELSVVPANRSLEIPTTASSPHTAPEPPPPLRGSSRSLWPVHMFAV
jgi:hypothetical protein